MTLNQLSVVNGRPLAAPSAGASSELDALRATCRRQTRVIDALTQAVRTLQKGGHALRAENAELRAEAQERRRSRPRNKSGDGGRPEQHARMEARFALEVSACAAARKATADWLADAVAAPVLEHCKLIVTELVTNSVRHSGMPAGAGVVARVELSPGSVRIEVEDPGSGGSIALRPPDFGAGGGFGLNLVQTLSDRWGVERAAQGPTRVWAELARAPSADVPEVG